jgi:transmembrane protein 17
MLTGMKNVVKLQDAASLPVLQLFLYYNALFSTAYLIFSSLNIGSKNTMNFSSTLNEALATPVLVFWAVSEAFRLYFAWFGNMNEKVPEISAFLLVTAFPQFPALLYLTFFQEHLYPFDRICGILMLVLISSEFLLGVLALRTLIRRQTAQFYRLCQEDTER